MTWWHGCYWYEQGPLIVLVELYMPELDKLPELVCVLMMTVLPNIMD